MKKIIAILSMLLMIHGSAYGLFGWGRPKVSAPKISRPNVPSVPRFSLGGLMQGVTQGGVAALQGAIALNQAKSSLSDMREEMTGAGEDGQGFMERMRADLNRQMEDAKRIAGEQSQQVQQTVQTQGSSLQQTMETQGNQVHETVTTQGNQIQHQIENQGNQVNETVQNTSADIQATLEKKTAKVEERFENQMADLEEKYTELEEQGSMTEDMWEQFEKEMADLEVQKEAELARMRETLDNTDAAIDKTSADTSAAMANANVAMLESQRLLQEQLAQQAAENARLRQMLEQQATQASGAVTDAAAGTRAQAQTSTADTTTWAQDTLSEAQTAVADTRTEMAAAIADTRAQASTAVDQTQSQVSDTVAAADEAVADASTQSRAVLNDAQTAVADTRAEAHAAVDDVHDSSLAALEDAQRNWVAQTIVVGSSAEQLGRHLQYFEPGRQLESYLQDQERAALESAQAQLADALTDLEVRRDEEIEMLLTGFEYDDFITARDEAIEGMVAADITGQAREVALQAASFEYRYDGAELTAEQLEKINTINNRYQEQAVAHQKVFAMEVQRAIHASAERLGDGFLSFQAQYATLVGQMTQQVAAVQSDVTQAALDAQALLEEENRRLQEERERMAQQVALVKAQGAVRLDVADFSIKVQGMLSHINIMTAEQLDAVAFKLSHAKELKKLQAEFVSLYKRLVEVELDYVRNEDGSIALEADGTQKETRDLRDLRDLRQRMINAVPQRKKALLKEQQARPQVTVSLGKKKG